MTGAGTWLRRAAAALVAVLVVLVVYGVTIEPRLWLDRRHYEIELSDLPAPLEGTRLAVFSDLQVGMWWANTGMVERIVDETLELDPDGVLIPGDFVYGHTPDATRQVDAVMELLAPLLHADVPVFVVLGNHDHAAGAADRLTDAFTQRGVTLLENEAVPLPLDGERSQLHVVGIGAHRQDRDDPDRAFSQLSPDEPRVVLMHNPASFTRIGAGDAPLAVAGHTHCGQIALPATPGWSYLELTRPEREVVDGFAPPGHGQPGNRLFVTCGVGFSLLPMRVSAPPQLVLFELVAAPSDGAPVDGTSSSDPVQ